MFLHYFWFCGWIILENNQNKYEMNKYELKGMFARYDQVYSKSELEEVMGWDDIHPDLIYIKYDENNQYDTPYYLEITVKYHDGVESYCAVYAYGKNLEDAEKNLEWKYEKFLKREISTNPNQGYIPNLSYMSVNLGVDKMYCDEFQKDIEDLIYGKFISKNNIFGNEDNTLWLLEEDEDSIYQLLDVDEYEEYPENDTKEEFILNKHSMDVYRRELSFVSSPVLFKRGVGIYHLKLDFHKPELFIHSRYINQHTLPKISKAIPISKAEVIHRWKWEQEYLDYGNMEHLDEKEMSKALSFLEEVKVEHTTLN